MGTGRTVLFHPLNHVGLGHINRLAAIALALHELDNSIRTPFVVEESAHVLLDVLGLPYVPLPSGHAINDSIAWASWTEDERSALQKEISQSVLRSIAPQLVVFDFLPNRSFADAVVSRGIPIVLRMREMRCLSAYLTAISDLLTAVKLIVVPHPEGTIRLPEALATKSRFVGQIVRRPVPMSALDTDPTAPRIVISGGGGGYPGTVKFYNLALKAIADLRHRYPALKSLLIVGPLFRDWSLLAAGDGSTIIPFEPDTASTFAQADLVICQAGYNTVAELEQLGTKAVLVPAERQWDDQFARAERAMREHDTFRVFRGNAPADLANVAVDFLGEHVANTVIPMASGGMNAAQLICSLLK